MKKKMFKVFGVLLLAFIIALPLNSIGAKTSDKFMEKYFPNGIEKIKPEKLLIDTSDTSYIGAIVK